MNASHRVLVPSSRFERAYRQYVGQDADRLARLEAALDRLRLNPFDAKLKTHSLRGSLRGCWACPCGYDCRIVFTIETGDRIGEERIILHEVGTHDEVY